MKKFIFKNLFVCLLFSMCFYSYSQMIIDHTCRDLSSIPAEWIDSAKAKLFIGYGHTSHGSQLTTGMSAIESYFTSGQYDWSHSGGPGVLHLFEGSSYSDGYLDHDCGYPGWDDKTRTYLDSFPDCNVIIWSWCGQVNGVNLPSHYLEPMDSLEREYPEVTFVYMTGHLEGLGPDGSLEQANGQIRTYCQNNNKILFDFADIEKYSPDADTNFQEYNCADNLDYDHPAGGTRNWADDWIGRNPGHELTQIADECSACSHSRCLNCILKGVASWWLWARIAGWDGILTTHEISTRETDHCTLYPNPTNGLLNIKITSKDAPFSLGIYDMTGRQAFQIDGLTEGDQQVKLPEFMNGMYIVKSMNDGDIITLLTVY